MFPSKDIRQSYKRIGQIEFRNAFEYFGQIRILGMPMKTWTISYFRNAFENLDNRHKQQKN